jgi:two-component system response regulator FixJ
LESGETETCYVVDDDDAFRSSLIALLTSAGYSCQGYALATEFIVEAARLTPGVLLLDLRMPQLTGLDFLETHPAMLERFAVVVISGHGDIGRAVRSIKAGALEFIEKPFAGDKLLMLVKAAQHALSRRASDSADRRGAMTKVAALSPREAEVLRLLVAGAPNKIVARSLDLSVRTVEMHRANMLAKLGARSTAEAIHLAMLGDVVPWPLPADRRY